MSKRKKIYIPSPKFNSVVQAQRIENNRSELEKLKQTITLITDSNEKHYQILGNFARHDIKNIIINLNSILDLYKENLLKEVVNSLELNIDSLSSIISNFSKLIPHADKDKFKFNELLIAAGILIRPLVDYAGIICIIDYDKKDETEINLPFQAVLQMINNLVVNAIKAVESTTVSRVKIEAYLLEGKLNIIIKDNGCPILKENEEKIFDFAFSTTNGSGIGLNHAKYLCEKFDGKISLSLDAEKNYNKSFNVTIPIV